MEPLIKVKQTVSVSVVGNKTNNFSLNVNKNNCIQTIGVEQWDNLYRK